MERAVSGSIAKERVDAKDDLARGYPSNPLTAEYVLNGIEDFGVFLAVVSACGPGIDVIAEAADAARLEAV